MPAWFIWTRDDAGEEYILWTITQVGGKIKTHNGYDAYGAFLSRLLVAEGIEEIHPQTEDKSPFITSISKESFAIRPHKIAQDLRTEDTRDGR